MRRPLVIHSGCNRSISEWGKFDFLFCQCGSHRQSKSSSVWKNTYNRASQRKFIDWKKTKLFLLSLELGRRDKVARHPSAENLSPHLFMTDNNAHTVHRKGWLGFCRYYYCCENALKGMRYNWFYENSILKNLFLYYFFSKIHLLCF